MSTASSTVDLLESRIRSLETSNRRFRLTGVALLALGVLGCLGGSAEAAGSSADASSAQAEPAADVAGNVVEAQAFVLRNADGEVAARLEMGELGPQFVLFGKADTPGVVMKADPFGNQIQMMANGVVRTELQASVHASIGGFTLRDDDQRVMMQAMTESGLSSVGLLGEASDNGVRAQLNLLMPAEGEPVVTMRTSDMRKHTLSIPQ